MEQLQDAQEGAYFLICGDFPEQLPLDTSLLWPNNWHHKANSNKAFL